MHSIKNEIDFIIEFQEKILEKYLIDDNNNNEALIGRIEIILNSLDIILKNLPRIAPSSTNAINILCASFEVGQINKIKGLSLLDIVDLNNRWKIMLNPISYEECLKDRHELWKKTLIFSNKMLGVLPETTIEEYFGIKKNINLDYYNDILSKILE